MDGENFVPQVIDPDEVPHDLRDLIPWAERFGIGSNVIPDDVAENMSRAEWDALSQALKGRHEQIEKWLNECYLEDGTLGESTEAANCFRTMCRFEAEYNDGPYWAGRPQWWAAKQDERRAEETRERFVQLSDGPACPQCGKPLRTAKARQCFSCGASWHDAAT